MTSFQFVCIMLIIVLATYCCVDLVTNLYVESIHTETVLKAELTTLREELKAHDERKEWWQAE